MTPLGGANTTEELVTAPTSAGTLSTAVELARLTGKVEQVIGDHERRITALEQRRDGGGQRNAAIWGPIIAGGAVVIALADKITWT